MSATILVWLSLAAVPAAFAAPTEEQVARAVVEARGRDLSTRLRLVTEPFLGAPYRLSALGEGAGVDPDPTLRFDAFDCTTFVETAMALALADDLAHARRILDVVRYRDGKVDYLARRHFPEAEWIPELVRLGFLEDITRAVAGDEVRVEEKRLDARVWHRARHQGMPALPDERIPNGTFRLDVWPLDLARAGAARIPVGTILHLVRVDYGSVPVRVSHQGIVLEKDGKRVLRHAADRMYHSVVDEPLDRFFSRMQQYKKWPVAGVHLTRATAPPSLPAASPPAAP
ncbi:MAG: DUF1460 domain-containing protein [Deltaproteobacteria bacterium]|nr:DUF1460 domain-containing protein [Deltaproteobacteria bacterium]